MKNKFRHIVRKYINRATLESSGILTSDKKGLQDRFITTLCQKPTEAGDIDWYFTASGLFEKLLLFPIRFFFYSWTITAGPSDPSRSSRKTFVLRWMCKEKERERERER